MRDKYTNTVITHTTVIYFIAIDAIYLIVDIISPFVFVFKTGTCFITLVVNCIFASLNSLAYYFIKLIRFLHTRIIRTSLMIDISCIVISINRSLILEYLC